MCHIHAGIEDQETDTCMLHTETCIVKTNNKSANYTHVHVSTRIKFFVRISATDIKVLVYMSTASSESKLAHTHSASVMYYVTLVTSQLHV